jgi:hypothetical protein
MAIRNTLIAAFRVAGWNNLKKARRHFSHTISRCLDLITRPVKTVKHQTRRSPASKRAPAPTVETSAANGPKSVTCDSSGAQRSRCGNEPVTDWLSCANAGIAGTALLLRDKRHTLDCFRSVATAP